MKYQSAALTITIFFVVFFIIATGNRANSTRNGCFPPKGCEAPVLQKENVRVLVEGEEIQVSSLAITLTENEAEVVKDPTDVLLKARSFLVTFYGYKAAQECRDVEAALNRYVTTVLVAESVWVDVSDRNGPISLCDRR